MFASFARTLVFAAFLVFGINANAQSVEYTASRIYITDCGPDPSCRFYYQCDVLGNTVCQGLTSSFGDAVNSALVAQQKFLAYANGKYFANQGTPQTHLYYNYYPGCINHGSQCAQVEGYIYQTAFSPNKNIPDPDKSCKKGQVETGGDPIVVANGNKVERLDLSSGTSDPMAHISLSYGSMLQGTIQFGPGWSSTYSASLFGGNQTLSSDAIAAGKVTGIMAVTDVGESTNFSLDSSGNWIPETQGRYSLIYSNGQFTLVDLELSRVEIYDSTGTLISRFAASGSYANLTYSSGVTTATTNQGRQLQLVTGSSGRVETFLDPSGTSTNIGYQTQPITALSTITYPDNTSKTFNYSNAANNFPLQMTSLVDENGVTYASWVYNGLVATSSTNAGGVAAASFDLTNPMSPTETLPNGSLVSYTFSSLNGRALLTNKSQPAGSGCQASTNAQAFDVNGNVTQRDDFNGFRTCFAYDSISNLETTRVEGLSNTAQCTSYIGGGAPIPAGSRKISTAWHPDWPFVTRMAEPKAITTTIYNGQIDPFNGNLPSNCAPAAAVLPNGRPIAVLCKKVKQGTTDSNGSQGLSAQLDTTVGSRVWSYTYNRYGQVLTETTPKQSPSDALSHTTTYVYYTDTSFSGSVGHTIGDLQTVTNPLEQLTLQSTSYDKAGRLLASTDANSAVTTQTYWPRGWLHTQTVTPAAGAPLTTTYDYWPTGLLKKVTMPDASTLNYTYDDAHRLTDVTDSAGNRVHYVLDNVGNRTSEQVSDASGVLASSVARAFDALNRIQAVTGAMH